MNLQSDITQAQINANQAADIYGATSAAEPAISDVLRQKITQAYADNQDIVLPLDKATMQYFEAPQVAREKYQNIFNPFSREKLVAQYQGNEALPMLSLSNMYGNRLGRIEDTLGAGVRGYQAQVQAAYNKAQLARQNYQDLLSQYVTNQQLESQRLSDQLAREKFEWSKSDSGSGGGSGGSTGNARISLQSDVSSYTPLETLVKKYGGNLDLYEIVNAYDAFHSNTSWGKHKESWDTIQKWTGSDVTPNQLSAIRTSLVEDIRGDLESGMNKDQSLRENRVLYPELSEADFLELYSAIWKETESQPESSNNLYDKAKSGLLKLIEPYQSGNYTFPKYV